MRSLFTLVLLTAIALAASCGSGEPAAFEGDAPPSLTPRPVGSAAPKRTPDTETTTPTATLPAPADSVQPAASATQPPASPWVTPVATGPAGRFVRGDTVEVNRHARSDLIIRSQASNSAPELRRERNGARLLVVDGPLEREGLLWYGFAEGGWAAEPDLQFVGEAPLPARFQAGDTVEVNTHDQDRLIIWSQASRSSPELRRVYSGTRLVIAQGPLTQPDGVTWWGFGDGGWAADMYLQYPGEAPLPPTPAPTPPPSATPPPYVPNVACALESTLRLYVDALDRRDFYTAYELGSRYFRSQRPFDVWTRGYDTTRWVTLDYARATSTAPAIAALQVSAGDYLNGGLVARTWSGTAYFVFEDGACRIDRMTLTQVDLGGD